MVAFPDLRVARGGTKSETELRTLCASDSQCQSMCTNTTDCAARMYKKHDALGLSTARPFDVSPTMRCCSRASPATLRCSMMQILSCIRELYRRVKVQLWCAHLSLPAITRQADSHCSLNQPCGCAGRAFTDLGATRQAWFVGLRRLLRRRSADIDGKSANGVTARESASEVDMTRSSTPHPAAPRSHLWCFTTDFSECNTHSCKAECALKMEDRFKCTAYYGDVRSEFMSIDSRARVP